MQLGRLQLRRLSVADDAEAEAPDVTRHVVHHGRHAVVISVVVMVHAEPGDL